MKNNFFNYLLNGTIILFLILVAYFGFNLVNNSLKTEKEIKEITDTSKTLTSQPNLTIQLEVQNGSGENGIAVRFTDYLRKNNMDVVEIGNYKSQDVAKTLVIDRSGDNIKARKVAQILGVSERSIIQQINSSLYLDVTVVIGKDFKELKPFLERKK